MTFDPPVLITFRVTHIEKRAELLVYIVTINKALLIVDEMLMKKESSLNPNLSSRNPHIGTNIKRDK